MMLRPDDLFKETGTLVEPVGAGCVHVLMAVHQGEDYLAQQLASLTTQTYSNWKLWVGLDAPETGADKSRNILNDSAVMPTIIDGPGQGVAANFMSLMAAAPAGEIWALADQDDVWLPHKLSRAVDALNRSDVTVPTLYCARTVIADNTLGRPRLSPRRPRGPGFANALVQNIASGNTIVLNGAATQLIADIIGDTDTPVVHDWWLYLVITGVGGRVICDDMPVLLYRQHTRNAIGANDCWAARFRRLRMIYDGIWSGWTDRNIATLQSVKDRLTPPNRQKLDDFAAARADPPLRRLSALRRLGIYRQRRGAGAVMWLAALIGRL